MQILKKDRQNVQDQDKEMDLSQPQHSTNEGTKSTRRVTVDCGPKMDEILELLAKELECTKADILRRSVKLLAYVMFDIPDGMHLAIVDADGQERKEIVLR